MLLHRKTCGNRDGESIRRQAELLAAARHPGVVELVGVEGGPDRPVLVTALVDGPTLAAPTVLSAEEVAGLAGALAATLADLHELGIVHGSVVPEHVLLRPDGQPVLCGFGAGGRIGETGPGDHELHPAVDVAGLGRLLRRLATGPDARALRRIAEAATADDPGARPSAQAIAAELAEAVPEARLPARHVSSAHGRDANDLRSLVAGARVDRRRPRPVRRRRVVADAASVVIAGGRERLLPQRGRNEGGAGLLGTDIGEWRGPDRADETVSGAGDDGRASREPATGGGLVADDPDLVFGAGVGPRIERPRPLVPSDGPRRPLAPDGRSRVAVSPRAAAVGVAGAVTAVALVLLAPWTSPARTEPPQVLPPTPTPAPSPSSAAPSTSPRPTVRTLTTVRADCAAPTSVLVADIDIDGCPDGLHYADGMLEAAGLRWSLGQEGDQLATGDWSCRGTRTLVLLRPSTGEVFRFDAWAIGAHDAVTGSPVARVPGGQAVRAADVDRDGCHELVVERGELPPQVVRLPRRQP